MLDLKLTDMRFMYLMELIGKDIYVGDKKCKRVKIYVGRPLRDTPKTYKRIGGFVAKELSNAYNSGCVSIYEAKDKTLRYSVYRDGCFLSLLREIRGGRIIPRERAAVSRRGRLRVSAAVLSFGVVIGDYIPFYTKKK